MRAHVELAYATTVHGAQGETVEAAHFLLGESTGAAGAYVAMTRGRNANTAHLVADARTQWVATFNRDRADLGPAHAADVALDDIDRYGPNKPREPYEPAPDPPRSRDDVSARSPRPEPPPIPAAAAEIGPPASAGDPPPREPPVTSNDER